MSTDWLSDDKRISIGDVGEEDGGGQRKRARLMTEAERTSTMMSGGSLWIGTVPCS
jgi:hypothetical protein